MAKIIYEDLSDFEETGEWRRPRMGEYYRGNPSHPSRIYLYDKGSVAPASKRHILVRRGVAPSSQATVVVQKGPEGWQRLPGVIRVPVPGEHFYYAGNIVYRNPSYVGNWTTQYEIWVPVPEYDKDDLFYVHPPSQVTEDPFIYEYDT